MDDRRTAFWEQLKPRDYPARIATMQAVLSLVKARADEGERPALLEEDQTKWEEAYTGMKKSIPTATHAAHPFIGECMRELNTGYFGKLQGCYQWMQTMHRLYMGDETRDGSKVAESAQVLEDQLAGVNSIIGVEGCVVMHASYRRYERELAEQKMSE